MSEFPTPAEAQPEGLAALSARPSEEEGDAGPLVATIHLHARPDGGLRVWSPNVLGLILSHSDPEKVAADIVPTLRALKAPNTEMLSAPTPPEDAGAMQEDIRAVIKAELDNLHRLYGLEAFRSYTAEQRLAGAVLAAFPQLSAPPQPAADRVREALREAAFLADRLGELDDGDPATFIRDFIGHAQPPLTRLRAALSALSALEAVG